MQSFLFSTKADSEHNTMLMVQYAIISAEVHRRKQKANEAN